MEFLASKKFSLVCAVVNAVWAFNSLILGCWGWTFLALVFCGLCTRNYLKAGK